MASIKPKPFKFETMWMSHIDFPNLVKNSWNLSNTHIHETIEDFKNRLTYWNNNTFKNIFKNKKKNTKYDLRNSKKSLQ